MVERDVPLSFIKGLVKKLSQHHRIQVSEGYTRAVSELKYILKNEQINFKIYRLPFKKDTEYFYQKFFPYWKINKGYLKIIEPFTCIIADYNEIPLSVIPRSKKTYGIYEIIDLEDEREGKNEGKILLTDDFKKAFYKVVGKDMGILYYGMPKIEGVRKEEELDDYIHYVSFWEEGFFGFSIPPKIGKYLKKILREGKKIRAEVKIDSEFSEGFIEIVEILLKGKKRNEEVWLISHLCHPAPFANDNISGVSISLGIAKFFSELMKNNNLKLKRNLRILLLPEMTGTCAYLSKFFNNKLNVISALNLDMTGEDQERCKSSLTVEREPHFLRSFSGYLAGYIMQFISDGIKNFGGTSEIEIFRKTITAYSGGSDHYILISPCFSIPSIMLNYWPDKFYHTTADTIDKVSEISLKNSYTLSSTFLYFLLNCEKEDIEALKEKIKEIFKKEMIELKIKESEPKKFKREYLGVINALNSLRRIDKSIKIEEDVKEIRKFLKDEKIELEKEEKIETKENFVLKKIYKGVPVSLSQHLDFEWRKKLDEYKEKEKNIQVLIDLISYLSDGKRNINEIINTINLEVETLNIDSIFFAVQVLQRAGFLEII